MARPLPLFTQATSGARFGREMFARAFWAGDLGGRYLGGSCPFTHLLLLPLRSFHPSRGDRDRTVHVGMASGEDGGSSVVEGGVVAWME